jgi:hypothetical protein
VKLELHNPNAESKEIGYLIEESKIKRNLLGKQRIQKLKVLNYKKFFSKMFLTQLQRMN